MQKRNDVTLCVKLNGFVVRRASLRPICTIAVVASLAGIAARVWGRKKKADWSPDVLSEFRDIAEDTAQPVDSGCRVKHSSDTDARYMMGDKAAMKQLRESTFAMIAENPCNEEIVWLNCTALYVDHRYALELIKRLEKAAAADENGSLYWSIAYICCQVAIPPTFKDSDEREDFLEYFGMPLSTKFENEDRKLAEKGISYYRRAIAASNESVFETAIRSEQLARFLRKLGRTDDALDVMEDALPSLNPVARPAFLVEYGRCLMKAGKYSAARTTLEDVRASDHGDSGFGPACQTTAAENLLGEIDLEQGRVGEATRHLLAACDVKKCPHNTRQGLPMRLAKKLIECGEYDAVIKYCLTATTIFGVSNRQTKAVLGSAMAAKERCVENMQ